MRRLSALVCSGSAPISAGASSASAAAPAAEGSWKAPSGHLAPAREAGTGVDADDGGSEPSALRPPEQV
jgi:hypothetical protein